MARNIALIMVALMLAIAATAAAAGSANRQAGFVVDSTLTGTSDDPAGATAEATTRAISGSIDGLKKGATYSGMITNTAFLEPPPVCQVCGLGQHFAAAGSITVVTANGSFTAEVLEDSEGSVAYPIHFTEVDLQLHLRVIDGTKRFQHAHGDVMLTYTSFTQLGGPGCVPVEDGGTCGVPQDTGTLTGSIDLSA